MMTSASPEKEVISKENELTDILQTLIRHVIGWGNGEPIGGIKVDKNSENDVQSTIGEAFQFILTGEVGESELNQNLSKVRQKMFDNFYGYYSREENQDYLQNRWEKFQKAQTNEERAQFVTDIFLPEMGESKEEIVKKWKLKSVKPNPNPYKPTEVLIQLNALYTLPTDIPEGLPEEMLSKWESIKDNDDPKLADYDHPVEMFEQDDHHELINCLKELNEEMSFEKDQQVIPRDYKFPILISISVTHKHLDSLCGDWIEWLLKKHHFENLKCLVLSEEKIDALKSEFKEIDLPVYTVLGKYATHFNALKYSQLIFEKAYGIRAGFKLDTDEGIRSKDLYSAKGKTWLQTMCHPLWGGEGVGHRGQTYYLGVNEGEYVNKKDIDNLGYENALRTPDVSIPKSYVSPEIFFNKAFAHGKCTTYYNEFETLEENISHPVVKGGGYGITNEGLRKAVPFTFSKVGRAEDQQFYFCSLAGGCRGIFHPDLRIAHYKSSGGAVAKAEEKTVATRFIGDMYRLIIFSHIVRALPELYHHEDKSLLKDEIDPMPGVFAGELSELQAFLNLLYRAYDFSLKSKDHLAEILLNEGVSELLVLLDELDKGEIQKGIKMEAGLWSAFVNGVDSIDATKAKNLLESFIV